MSSWPDVVLLLATRCLYLVVCLSSGQPDLTLYWSWPPGASTGVHLSWVCANVKLTLCSGTLGHWMHLWGVHLSSGQPGLTQFWAGYIWLVLLLATRCLYWGLSDLSAKRTSENLKTLCISCFASQRSFLWKTNKSSIFMKNMSYLFCYSIYITTIGYESGIPQPNPTWQWVTFNSVVSAQLTQEQVWILDLVLSERHYLTQTFHDQWALCE